MQDTRPSISFSRPTIALAALGLFALSGCSIESSRLDDVRAMFETTPLQVAKAPMSAQPIAAQPIAIAKQVTQAAQPQVILKPQLRQSVISDLESKSKTVTVSPAGDAPRASTQSADSSWCTSLRESAIANGYVLQSPILGSSYDAQGKAEASLGLSYSNFHRASLLKDRAEVECHRYMAQTALQNLVFTTPQNLTKAGFRAKADAIDAEKFELARLRQNVRGHMDKGDINREKATALLMLIDQLHADGQSARSQADRRMPNDGQGERPAHQLGNDLLRAEYDLDQVDSEIRTAENFDVGAQATYSQYMDGTPAGVNANTLGFGGKVTFSMKLGVVDPRRFEHERLATAAKLRAIRDESPGTISQARDLSSSQQQAIAGLEESRRQLIEASSEAKHLLESLADVEQSEFEGAKLNARFQILKLKSDQAAVDGSLADIRRNLHNLSNG